MVFKAWELGKILYALTSVNKEIPGLIAEKWYVVHRARRRAR
jgi:hypothetical protein